MSKPQNLKFEFGRELENSFISYAEWRDGTPLTEDELDQLGLEYPELIHEAWFERQIERAEYEFEQ